MRAFLMGALVFFMGFSALANWEVEQKRINFLITAVENLDATFIRNGNEYDAHTAAQHLRDKLQQATSSPFGPRNQDMTAEDFIENIASKSYLTGKPYFIKFHDGRQVPARDWLYQELSQFQN